MTLLEPLPPRSVPSRLLAQGPAALPEPIAPPQAGWTAADSLKVAWADAKLLGPQEVCYVRYLDLHPVPPEDRVKAVIALAGHLNLLSDRNVPARPVLVGKVLVRLNLQEYARDERLHPFVATYEKLAEVDPYYHVQRVEYRLWPGGGKRWRDGRTYPYGSFRYRVAHAEPAPELLTGPQGRKLYDELAALTHSRTPLLPADWFLSRTAIQVDRDGTGYYDFLGVKTLDDLERLAGVPKKSLRREVLESVSKSKVTTVGVLRGIERRAGEDGGRWATYDFRLAKARRDPRAVVDPRRVPLNPKDFAEAIEYIGPLPNGGITNAAVDAKTGNLQATVPDFIAQHRGHPHDNRIHPNVGCLKCHGATGGLMPIEEWYRNLGTNPLDLGVADFRERVRYNEQYGRQLMALLDKDRRGFEDWAKESAGVPFKEFADAYGHVFDAYEYADVDAAWAARRLGVTQQEYQDALDRGIRLRKLDLLLAGHRLTGKGRSRSFDVRTWEVLYPLAQAALRGEYPQADYRLKNQPNANTQGARKR